MKNIGDLGRSLSRTGENYSAKRSIQFFLPMIVKTIKIFNRSEKL